MMATPGGAADYIANTYSKGRVERLPSADIAREEDLDMTLKSDWETVRRARLIRIRTERLFFTEHEWDTIEAATARIMPTDHDPGAHEARVIVFIDRYVSGIDYIFAAADGSGFLKHGRGRCARSPRAQPRYCSSCTARASYELDAAAHAGRCRSTSCHADDEAQDAVLVELSGNPKPVPVRSTSTRCSTRGCRATPTRASRSSTRCACTCDRASTPTRCTAATETGSDGR